MESPGATESESRNGPDLTADLAHLKKLDVNIVISSSKFEPMLGGSVIYCSMMAAAFKRLGHGVTVVTRTRGNSTGRPYGVLREPSSRQLWQLAGATDVLLQVESSWRDAWPFILRGVPWFPTVHRGRPSRPSGFIKSARLFSEILAFRFGKTIGVSDYVDKSWGLREAPIPNPYDAEIFFPPDPTAPRDIDVLFVGRMTRDKGIFVLVDALEMLVLGPRRMPLRKIAFVGTGADENELRNAVGRLANKITLEFPGKLDPLQVAESMRRSRVLAFPTTPAWLEASGLSLLEALACGCHVVASDIGGVRENVHLFGRLVVPGSASSLADGLAEALTGGGNQISPPLAEFLRQRRPETIATQYLERFSARH